MLKHNLLIFLGNMKKDKSSFFINIMGLSIGLACVIMIYIWVENSLSMDKFYVKDNRVVQILKNNSTPNGLETNEHTPGPLAKTLAQDFPEVEHSTSVIPNDYLRGRRFMLSNGKDGYFNSKNQFASKEYFNIFSYELLHGDRGQVLADVNSVVVSKELAEKLFGTTNVVGETLEWIHGKFSGIYNVSGVFTVPSNSSIEFDAIFSYDLFLKSRPDLEDWSQSDPLTYVSLKTKTNVDTFNSKIKNLLKSKNINSQDLLFAQVFSEKYLNDVYKNGKPSGGKIESVILFTIIAIFILIIACVNFVNLSTAQVTTRLKEIGVKKAMGISRKKLIVQFLSESMIMTIAALILSFIIVILVLPQFSAIFGKMIAPNFNFWFLAVMVFIALTTGLIAGSYPAFFFSGVSSVSALNGELTKGKKGQAIRKGLVIFQFAISTLLIISVFVVQKQLEQIQYKDLGYNKDNIMTFKMGILETSVEDDGRLSEAEIEGFLQKLRNIPGVINASQYAYFVDKTGTTTDLKWSGKNPNQEILFANIAAGYEFIESADIKMKEGRSYSRLNSTEASKIIFNEEAIKQMQITDPIGKVVSLWGENVEIIGVTKDFHFETFYEKIKPLFIKLTTDWFAGNFMVKIQAGSEVQTIKRVKEAYDDYFITGLPFEFDFLDSNYQKLYEQEIRVGLLSHYAAIMAIFISCIGLFGLATFTAERRKKEIGIRKVLGQADSQIVLLLTKEFAKLVIVSIIIALPIAYLIVDKWLSNFAYKIDLKFTYFFLAGLLVLIVSLFTVSVQAIQAAKKNPIDALRDQ